MKSFLASSLIALCAIQPASRRTSDVGPRMPAAQGLRFEISFPAGLSSLPLAGRLFLLISKDTTAEPRFQINERADASQQIFGIDVDSLAPGHAAVIDGSVLGYPARNLGEIPAGDYRVQGVLNSYETFRRSDGHVLKLPMDHGEGQAWNIKPGNLYSQPEKIHLDPASGGVIRISLTEKIPPIEPPRDTKYIKHLRLQSKLLSDFWGRPMDLGAIVLLPEGYEDHPSARYPLMVYQDHFTRDFSTPVEFRTEPPDAGAQGLQRTRQEYSYKFYQDWVSGRLPRMIILSIQHANPYYDDSYAVNSANLGPYGDAIVKELTPYVEARFRAIGQPWARVLYGGSTGGWEAMAMQVFYPDFFNGAWVFCPDPIDFRAFQLINIYKDENAFWIKGPFGKVPRPFMREPSGTIHATGETETEYELVLGTRGRSAEQLDIWQAVFSPVGADGYPKPIWDPVTGAIDHEVAAYWGEHYDLSRILQRDWKTLGPKLTGKLHFTVGDADSYYLNNAVHLFQDFADSPANPYRVDDFDYGPRMPHCYSGDPSVPVSVSRYTVNQRVMPVMERWMTGTAPKDADVSSWKY